MSAAIASGRRGRGFKSRHPDQQTARQSPRPVWNRMGRAARCLLGERVLFRAAFRRTPRTSFDVRGSPVIYAV
ncbi:MAG: hypothetical protein LC775_13920, partial [Acidobacteria bacterium]|nr:hypothetical protein [Acidobacteriota bacterium]